MAEKFQDNERKHHDEEEVPSNFYCPLSRQIMIDPVILTSGNTYERSVIQTWIAAGNTIDPVSTEVLDSLKLTPNHVCRQLITLWCHKNGKSDLRKCSYNLLTTLDIRLEYFEALHRRVSSEVSEEQKSSAKKLREEASKRPYFRNLYQKAPDAIVHLVAPLCRYKSLSEIDEDLQQDLIETLYYVCLNEEVKEGFACFPEGIRVLIQALQSDLITTQRTAVQTIYEIASSESTKNAVGDSEALMTLAMLLMGERKKFLGADVIRTLLSLIDNNGKNKALCIKYFKETGIFAELERCESLEILLPIFANLSGVITGFTELENYKCNALFRVLRESRVAEQKEDIMVILFNASKCPGSKWLREMRKEELLEGSISEISLNGNPNAKFLANMTLHWLKENLPKDTSRSGSNECLL